MEVKGFVFAPSLGLALAAITFSTILTMAAFQDQQSLANQQLMQQSE
ncbi:MAG: hypothetical protein GOV15_04145, partial [Candidatus Diapherotrites archaeon]|nr:hypothetical protein [Candidatus Diapherotrites archaeon]